MSCLALFYNSFQQGVDILSISILNTEHGAFFMNVRDRTMNTLINTGGYLYGVP